MRIIAGAMKGRKLIVPPGLDLRPTSDKVKGALFNILSQRIAGASFLDLYAGTGSVGIEALSRGARSVVFVEKNPRHLQYLKKNLALCPTEEKIKVFPSAASIFLKKTAPFDFVFVDPPYESDEIENILRTLEENDMITDDGMLIFQHFHKKNLPEKIRDLILIGKYKYGETLLSFYAKK